MRLTVAPESHGLVLLPNSPLAWAELVRLGAAVAETTVLASCRGESACFAVLVCRVADPVDLGVVADGLLLWVDADDFEPLIDTVLVDPVAIQDADVSEFLSNALLSDDTAVLDELAAEDTGGLWLTVGDSTVHWALVATTADANAVHAEAGLALVAETACLLWASGACEGYDALLVSVFPGAETLKVGENFTALLSPELVHVSVGSHCELYGIQQNTNKLKFLEK